MTNLLNAAALCAAGPLVGIEAAVALLSPVFNRLPHGADLAVRTASARLLGRVMPVWYAASIVLSTAVAVGWWEERGALAALAAVLFAVAIVLSVLLLVPINNRVQTWTAQNAPADWPAQLRRWDRLHLVRLGVVALGLIALAFAIAR